MPTDACTKRRVSIDDNANEEYANFQKETPAAMEKLIKCHSGLRHVLQVGLNHWIDEMDKSPFAGISRVIFVIPGNPGGILFYKSFMEQLHQRTGLPVIGAGHTGLSRRCPTSMSGPLTVRRLVDDEITFIEDFIPSEVEIILVGHSIGTFIAMDIMRLSQDRQRFVHSVMTMPALQNLRSTPGAFIIRIISCVSYLLYAFVFLLSLVPDSVLRKVFRGLVGLLWDTAECSVEGMVELAHTSSVRNSIFLAHDEFNQVQDIDQRFMSRNIERISFVFAEVDEWVPRKLVTTIKEMFPSADAVIVPETLHVFFFSQKMTNDIVSQICMSIEKFKVPDGAHQAPEKVIQFLVTSFFCRSPTVTLPIHRIILSSFQLIFSHCVLSSKTPDS